MGDPEAAEVGVPFGLAVEQLAYGVVVCRVGFGVPHPDCPLLFEAAARECQGPEEVGVVLVVRLR